MSSIQKSIQQITSNSALPTMSTLHTYSQLPSSPDLELMSLITPKSSVWILKRAGQLESWHPTKNPSLTNSSIFFSSPDTYVIVLPS